MFVGSQPLERCKSEWWEFFSRRWGETNKCRLDQINRESGALYRGCVDWRDVHARPEPGLGGNQKTEEGDERIQVYVQSRSIDEGRATEWDSYVHEAIYARGDAEFCGCLQKTSHRKWHIIIIILFFFFFFLFFFIRREKGLTPFNMRETA